MTPHARGLLVARLLSGRLAVRLGGSSYAFRPQTAADVWAAAEAATEAYQEAADAGVMGEADALALLVEQGRWADADDALLAQVEKDIETLKVKLFEFVFKAAEREAARKLLAKAKAARLTLYGRKHALAALTREGVAEAARWKVLAGLRLTHRDGSPVWPASTYESDDTSLLEDAAAALASSRLTEAEVREIARTDPWRGHWGCRETETSLFGCPAGALTDCQKAVVGWSRTYDMAASHDGPPDEVVEDDDMFDGWLILQRRLRDKQARDANATQVVGNQKIANSEEVFIVTGGTPEDVGRISALNDPAAQAMKARRMALVDKKGQVQEAEMPDSKQRILAQFMSRGAKQ